jgi:DNA-binding Lrp family transcriptional regulator
MLGKPLKEITDALADMEKSGVLAKYTVLVNESRLGSDGVQALIEVKVSPQFSHGFDSIAQDIYQFDEVKSVYLMSGAYDLAVFIEGKTLREVAGFVSEKLSVMDKVLSTATHFILKKYKSDGVVLEDEKSKRLAVNP